MDKRGIMEEKNSFKKISVVPNEKDFADAIVSLFRKQISTFVPKGFATYRLRQLYNKKLWSACLSFKNKLSTVFNEFPAFDRIHPSYAYFLCWRYNNAHQYINAHCQVHYAREVIFVIANDFESLLDKDDCDSLDKCKRLLVAALGCMFTVAVRCSPSLAYLEKVRQYMASLPMTASNLEVDKAALTLTKSTSDDATLALEDCPFPLTVDVQNFSDFVHPKVLSWLDDLEREHGLKPRDDQAATISSMKALVI